MEKNNLYYEQNAKAVSLVIRSQMSLAMFALIFFAVIVFSVGDIMKIAKKDTTLSLAQKYQ